MSSRAAFSFFFILVMRVLGVYSCVRFGFVSTVVLVMWSRTLLRKGERAITDMYNFLRVAFRFEVLGNQVLISFRWFELLG